MNSNDTQGDTSPLLWIIIFFLCPPLFFAWLVWCGLVLAVSIIAAVREGNAQDRGEI